MAIIQKIRNRAGLLVSVVIGAALVAFILGDFLTSGNVSFSSSKNNIAEVNGKGIPIDKYQRKLTDVENVNKVLRNVSALDEQTSNAIREQVWQDIINDEVMGREYEKLGLSIHGDELSDLIIGDNPHMVIQQLFGDPRSGSFNPMVVKNFWQRTSQLEEANNEVEIRDYLEDIIERDAKLQKYNTLLSKGLYATNLEAKRRKTDLNKTVDFSYVVKRYSEIPDTTVSVSDSELKSYYKKHQEEYKQEKTRDIRYVVWDIVPTQKDIKDAEKWINESLNDIKPLDAAATWQYIKSNSDLPPNDKNYVQGELPETIDGFAFSSEEGAIYGPYFEDNTYKVAKLIKIESLPDSVKASHILLNADQNNFMQQKAIADSLMELVVNGADFAELARKHSTDGSKADGGDLGWFKEGQMVRPFNDSCFYGSVGDIKMVYSQFGIHIVKIANQSRDAKKVKVGILTREVRPDDGEDVYFLKANEFGGKNRTATQFDDAIKADQALTSRVASNIRKSDQNITGLEKSRELIRWAFKAKEGEVTPEVYQFGDKYIVAILDKIRDDEYSPFEDVKETIKIAVRKEKQGEQLKSELKESMAGLTDINGLASKIGTSPKVASNIRFSSYSIPQLGAEPKLIAAAVNLESGVLSQPIDGQNGVYIIQVDNINNPEMTEDFKFEKNYLERGYGSRINFSSATVLKDLAEVEDNRLPFF